MGKQLEGKYLEEPLRGSAAARVQEKAADQLIRILSAAKTKTSYPPLWGDEIEYAIVRIDHEQTQATLSLKQSFCLEKLNQKNHDSEYSAEFAKYMVEGMPSMPYGADIEDMLKVEESMKNR